MRLLVRQRPALVIVLHAQLANVVLKQPLVRHHAKLVRLIFVVRRVLVIAKVTFKEIFVYCLVVAFLVAAVYGVYFHPRLQLVALAVPTVGVARRLEVVRRVEHVRLPLYLVRGLVYVELVGELHRRLH